MFVYAVCVIFLDLYHVLPSSIALIIKQTGLIPHRFASIYHLAAKYQIFSCNLAARHVY